jgi:hypothetical protein
LLLLGPLDGVSALLFLAALPALVGAALEGRAAARKRMFVVAAALLAFAAINDYTRLGLQVRFSKHAFVDPAAVPSFVGWNALSNVQATQFSDVDPRG